MSELKPMEGYLHKYSPNARFFGEWRRRYFRLQYVFVPNITYGSPATYPHPPPPSPPSPVFMPDDETVKRKPTVPTRRPSVSRPTRSTSVSGSSTAEIATPSPSPLFLRKIPADIDTVSKPFSPVLPDRGSSNRNQSLPLMLSARPPIPQRSRSSSRPSLASPPVSAPSSSASNPISTHLSPSAPISPNTRSRSLTKSRNIVQSMQPQPPAPLATSTAVSTAAPVIPPRRPSVSRPVLPPSSTPNSTSASSAASASTSVSATCSQSPVPSTSVASGTQPRYSLTTISSSPSSHSSASPSLPELPHAVSPHAPAPPAHRPVASSRISIPPNYTPILPATSPQYKPTRLSSTSLPSAPPPHSDAHLYPHQNTHTHPYPPEEDYYQPEHPYVDPNTEPFRQTHVYRQPGDENLAYIPQKTSESPDSGLPGTYQWVFGYYSNDTAAFPSLSLPLSSLLLVKPSLLRKEQFCFQLDFPNKTLLLRAHSQVELEAWVRGIIAAVTSECNVLGLPYQLSDSALLFMREGPPPELLQGDNNLGEMCAKQLRAANDKHRLRQPVLLGHVGSSVRIPGRQARAASFAMPTSAVNPTTTTLMAPGLGPGPLPLAHTQPLPSRVSTSHGHGGSLPNSSSTAAFTRTVPPPPPPRSGTNPTASTGTGASIGTGAGISGLSARPGSSVGAHGTPLVYGGLGAPINTDTPPPRYHAHPHAHGHARSQSSAAGAGSSVSTSIGSLDRVGTAVPSHTAAFNSLHPAQASHDTYTHTNGGEAVPSTASPLEDHTTRNMQEVLNKFETPRNKNFSGNPNGQEKCDFSGMTSHSRLRSVSDPEDPRGSSPPRSRPNRHTGSSSSPPHASSTDATATGANRLPSSVMTQAKGEHTSLSARDTDRSARERGGGAFSEEAEVDEDEEDGAADDSDDSPLGLSRLASPSQDMPREAFHYTHGDLAPVLETSYSHNRQLQSSPEGLVPSLNDSGTLGPPGPRTRTLTEMQKEKAQQRSKHTRHSSDVSFAAGKQGQESQNTHPSVPIPALAGVRGAADTSPRTGNSTLGMHLASTTLSPPMELRRGSSSAHSLLSSGSSASRQLSIYKEIEERRGKHLHASNIGDGVGRGGSGSDFMDSLNSPRMADAVAHNSNSADMAAHGDYNDAYTDHRNGVNAVERGKIPDIRKLAQKSLPASYENPIAQLNGTRTLPHSDMFHRQLTQPVVGTPALPQQNSIDFDFTLADEVPNTPPNAMQLQSSRINRSFGADEDVGEPHSRAGSVHTMQRHREMSPMLRGHTPPTHRDVFKPVNASGEAGGPMGARQTHHPFGNGPPGELISPRQPHIPAGGRGAVELVAVDVPLPRHSNQRDEVALTPAVLPNNHNHTSDDWDFDLTLEGGANANNDVGTTRATGIKAGTTPTRAPASREESSSFELDSPRQAAPAAHARSHMLPSKLTPQKMGEIPDEFREVAAQLPGRLLSDTSPAKPSNPGYSELASEFLNQHAMNASFGGPGSNNSSFAGIYTGSSYVSPMKSLPSARTKVNNSNNIPIYNRSNTAANDSWDDTFGF